MPTARNGASAITAWRRPPVGDWRRAWAAFIAYLASDDPLAAASNKIAMAVVGNQPFYPLYVWWFVGDDGWTSLVTFLSTPLFAMIPAVGRRWSAIGRLQLPVVGVLNTIVCAKAFGIGSGVDLFVVPCIVIAVLSFRDEERWWMLAAIAVPTLAVLAARPFYGAPLHPFTAAQYASFRSMNVISVAMLTGLIGLTYASARASLAAA